MKKSYVFVTAGLLSLSAISSTFSSESNAMSYLKPAFYVGVGGGWNTIDERFQSTLSTTHTQAGLDSYRVSNNRLFPSIGVGYWHPFKTQWLWGISAQWAYLSYNTPNANNPNGQYLPNASFSSINIFGPDVLRDFSSRTKMNNQITLLFYAGNQLNNGYVYLGAGPALFTASNSIFVSSVHQGGGDILFSNSVSANKTLWGGAIQAGYDYFLSRFYFLNFSYTYSRSADVTFNNAVNAAQFNGAVNPGGTTLTLNRTVHVTNQQVMASINRML